MKKLIFLILSMFHFIASGQKVVFPWKESSIVFESINEAKGLKKVDLFKNAKVWFATFFNSAKDVIQMEDKTEGIIIGKGSFDYEFLVAGRKTPTGIKWTIRIDFKDEKFRTQVYDIQTYILTKDWTPIEKGVLNYQESKDFPKEFINNTEELYKRTNDLLASLKKNLLVPKSEF